MKSNRDKNGNNRHVYIRPGRIMKLLIEFSCSLYYFLLHVNGASVRNGNCLLIGNFSLPYKNWQASSLANICHLKSKQMFLCTRANGTRHIKIVT